MSDKVYWIGDDGDNKSVSIAREIYVKGNEIPVAGVAQELLDEWKRKGLIAVGDSAAPVVIIDSDAVNGLKTEIEVLKRDVDRIPGLEREISDLKKAAGKSKGGSKAKALKAKDDHIKDLEDNAIAQSDRIKTLELDNQEKAALIDKLNADLETATAPDDDTGSADDTGATDDAGAGPGSA